MDNFGKFKLHNKDDVILFIISFFNFIGYYIVIITAVYFNVEGGTLLYTVVIRLSVLALILLFFLSYHIHVHKEGLFVHLLMMIFLCAYVFQSVNAHYTGVNTLGSRAPILHIGMAVIYLYLPFVFFSTLHLKKHFKIVLNALIYSALLFSFLVLLLYWELLMSGISRITFAIYSGIEIGTLNALILAYTSSIAIGVYIAYKVFNRNECWSLYSFLYIGVLLIPFFLGSSRGALIALIVPFFMIVLLSGSYRSRLNLLFLSLFGILAIYFLATYFDFGVFRRTLRIAADLEAGRSSERIYLWGHAITQFLSSPIYGDMIYFTGVGAGYPHNIILEILMSTGLIGGVSYITILMITIYYSFYIVKYNPKLNWVVVLYWQSFIAASLSFELIVQVTHFSSIGLLISAGNISKKRIKR